MSSIRQLRTAKHYTAQLELLRKDPAIALGHYRRQLDQIRCDAVKVTFEHGTMRCSRTVGHLNDHLDKMSGASWS